MLEAFKGGLQGPYLEKSRQLLQAIAVAWTSLEGSECLVLQRVTVVAQSHGGVHKLSVLLDPFPPLLDIVLHEIELALISAFLLPLLLCDELDQNIAQKLPLLGLDHPLPLEKLQEGLAPLEFLDHGQFE